MRGLRGGRLGVTVASRTGGVVAHGLGERSAVGMSKVKSKLPGGRTVVSHAHVKVVEVRFGGPVGSGAG